MVKLKTFGAARLATLAIACCISTQTFAQTSQQSTSTASSTAANISMTLDECLEYAKQNSITLKQAKIEVENNRADQISAKGAFLPTISGSVGQNVNSNPINTDPTASKSSYSGSYSLNLSMTLYNGSKNRSTLQQTKLSGDIANLELDEFENSIEVSVTEIYVEILYAMEQITVAENSLSVSEQNEARGLALFEVGSINEVDYAQLQSATATYKYNLISAKTQLSNLYVALKHLLEITQNVTFSVKEPQLSDDLLLAMIPSVEEVYETALEDRPEIISSKLYVESAELSARIAKAGYLPTLSLSASTGLTHNTSEDFNFSNQLRNNYNTKAGVTLSIPIFNNFSTRSSVTQAINDVQYASLTLNQAQKDLYQTIETLHNNAETSQAKYSVSEFQLMAAQKSLDLTQKQYEVGMKNIIELLTEQDDFTQANQEYLINKYQLILNKALLNYYKTNIIKL